ncbi:MAG TPA: hypothetical protein VGP55_03945 [Chitinophagaceae bacterium]|nr:hypothetical protein [Chitinophagaceae bacterium]
MKQIKKMLLITLSASSLLYSCSGNNNAAINKDSTSSPTSSTENSSENSSGDASFSCKIDGKDFSGKGNADNLAAFKSGSGVVTFVLAHIEPNQQGIPEQLHLPWPTKARQRCIIQIARTMATILQIIPHVITLMLSDSMK